MPPTIQEKTKSGSAKHKDFGEQWAYIANRWHYNNCGYKSANERETNLFCLASIEFCTSERKDIIVLLGVSHDIQLDLYLGKNFERILLKDF